MALALGLSADVNLHEVDGDDYDGNGVLTLTLLTLNGSRGHVELNGSVQYKDFYERARFITGLVIYPIICVLGLLGNSLCIVVMTRRQMTSSTNVYLLSLAISDSVKLLSDFLYFVVVLLYHVDTTSGDRAYGCLYPYAHYIFNSSLCVSAWLTVSVAFERYIYVCHPTKVKTYCTLSRARAVSFAVFLSMSVMAIPYAMRYRTVQIFNNHTQILTWKLEVTELWRNDVFASVYTWVQNGVRSILPLVVLVGLNVTIMVGMRRCRIGRSKSGRRHRISIMLVCVVVVFLVCTTPDAVLSTVLGIGYYEEGFLQRGIREITDLLLLLNSGCNFVLYCIFNTIFWRNFLFLFCSRCYPGQATTTEDSNMRRLSLMGRPGRSTFRRSGKGRGSSRRASSSKSCNNGWKGGGGGGGGVVVVVGGVDGGGGDSLILNEIKPVHL